MIAGHDGAQSRHVDACGTIGPGPVPEHGRGRSWLYGANQPTNRPTNHLRFWRGCGSMGQSSSLDDI